MHRKPAGRKFESGPGHIVPLIGFCISLTAADSQSFRDPSRHRGMLIPGAVGRYLRRNRRKFSGALLPPPRGLTATALALEWRANHFKAEAMLARSRDFLNVFLAQDTSGLRPSPKTGRLGPTKLDSFGQVLSLKESSYFVTKPARSRPRRASALFMNVFHTKPLRRFSAINIVMPVSRAITSVSYQPVRGLNAFTNP